MTPEILDYLKSMKPLIGKNRSVLEIGSMNVNGSARTAIHHKKWLGLDIDAGPDVDVVIDEESVDYDDFVEKEIILPDTIVICECLEHARYPIDIVSSAEYALVRARQIAEPRDELWFDADRRGSLMVITSPSYHFPYHAYPRDYWRFSKDTLEDVFFAGMEILDLRYLDSNEGRETTVAGIARVNM